jgi:hypothetical protein
VSALTRNCRRTDLLGRSFDRPPLPEHGSGYPAFPMLPRPTNTTCLVVFIPPPQPPSVEEKGGLRRRVACWPETQTAAVTAGRNEEGKGTSRGRRTPAALAGDHRRRHDRLELRRGNIIGDSRVRSWSLETPGTTGIRRIWVEKTLTSWSLTTDLRPLGCDSFAGEEEKDGRWVEESWLGSSVQSTAAGGGRPPCRR